MKVLLVNKFHYKKGGAETYYFALAEALRARGHEVIFFSMRDEKNLPCAQEKYFVSNVSVNGSFKSRIKMAMHIAYSKEAYRSMTRLLEDERPDLVMLNNIHRQITLSVIDAVKDFDPKLPIFWTVHDFAAICPDYLMLDGNGKICEKCLDGNFGHCIENRCIKGSRLMGVLAKYEADYIRGRGLYDKVDLYICPSKFMLRKLQTAGFAKGRLVMLRNPLPLNTEYQLSDCSGGYVLYFGRLSREKGVKTLIDAVRKTGYRLEILGTGPIEDDLKNYVRRINAENITFRGFQTGQALRDYVKGCRCVVLPSEWYENCPYNGMEAMALGKPLVVSSYGGLPELVEEGKNGYIYDTAEDNPVETLSACLKKILMLPRDEYRNLEKYSLEKATEMFDPTSYASRIETLWAEQIKKLGQR